MCYLLCRAVVTETRLTGFLWESGLPLYRLGMYCNARFDQLRGPMPQLQERG